MKKSKRISALIAAVLMIVTMFSSAVPVQAKITGLNCNGYTFQCSGSSKNSDRGAEARTYHLTHNTKYLYVYVLGNQQDKDGYNTKYISDSSYREGKKSSEPAEIKVTSYQFVKIVSTHIVRDGSDEQAKVLQIK